MNSNKKPTSKPTPQADDSARADKDRPIPFGEKADARTSPRKEQKTWEEVESEVRDDMTPG